MSKALEHPFTREIVTKLASRFMLPEKDYSLYRHQEGLVEVSRVIELQREMNLAYARYRGVEQLSSAPTVKQMQQRLLRIEKASKQLYRAFTSAFEEEGSGMTQYDPTHASPESLISLEEADRQTSQAAMADRFKLITAETLQAKDFPPLEFVIERLLVPGLTILAGRPKEGKSWMALDLCYAVAAGDAALGHLDAVQGDVLYLALEDNQRRLKARLNKVRPLSDWPRQLSFGSECPRLDDGGLELIGNWFEVAKKPKLIVIDVFAKVRPMRNGKESSYEGDYAATAPLQKFAIENDVAILAIHHTRKMGSDDPLEQVSGTNGFTGAADSILVLRREAINSGDAVLYARGRDIPECELALSFSDEDCRWSHLGDAGEFRATKESNEIIEILRATEEPLSPKDVAAQIDHIPLSTTQKRMQRMEERGEIEKETYGRYKPVHPVHLSI